MNKTYKLLCKEVFQSIAAHVNWISAICTKRTCQPSFNFICSLCSGKHVSQLPSWMLLQLLCVPSAGGNIRRDKWLGIPEIKHKVTFSFKTLLLFLFSLLPCTIILLILVKCPSSHLWFLQNTLDFHGRDWNP